MKLLRLPSGKVLNLDQFILFDMQIGTVTVLAPGGIGLAFHHDDAKALRAYLDENSDFASASLRAETLAEIGGGH